MALVIDRASAPKGTEKARMKNNRSSYQYQDYDSDSGSGSEAEEEQEEGEEDNGEGDYILFLPKSYEVGEKNKILKELFDDKSNKVFITCTNIMYKNNGNDVFPTYEFSLGD